MAIVGVLVSARSFLLPDIVCRSFADISAFIPRSRLHDDMTGKASETSSNHADLHYTRSSRLLD